MFGMGFGEMLVVLIIAVIFLGPDKIPETAHTLGKWFQELKSSMDDLKKSFEEGMNEKTQTNTEKPTVQNPQIPENTTPPKNS